MKQSMLVGGTFALALLSGAGHTQEANGTVPAVNAENRLELKPIAPRPVPRAACQLDEVNGTITYGYDGGNVACVADGSGGAECTDGENSWTEPSQC